MVRALFGASGQAKGSQRAQKKVALPTRSHASPPHPPPGIWLGRGIGLRVLEQEKGDPYAWRKMLPSLKPTAALESAQVWMSKHALRALFPLSRKRNKGTHFPFGSSSLVFVICSLTQFLPQRALWLLSPALFRMVFVFSPSHSRSQSSSQSSLYLGVILVYFTHSFYFYLFVFGGSRSPRCPSSLSYFDQHVADRGETRQGIQPSHAASQPDSQTRAYKRKRDWR